MRTTKTSSFMLPSRRTLASLSPVARDTVNKWEGNVRLQAPLRAVVFDLGNVLTDFDFNKALWRICDRENQGRDGLFAQKALNTIVKSDIKGDLERGKVGFPDFYEHVRSQLGLANTGFWHFTRIWNSIFTFRPDTEMLMTDLQRSGRAVFILSDTNVPHFSYIRRNSPAVRRAEHRFLSYEESKSKSDGPALFEHVVNTLQNRFGIFSGSAIYFDDIDRYTTRMIALGLPAFTFTNAADARTVIREVWGFSA